MNSSFVDYKSFCAVDDTVTSDVNVDESPGVAHDRVATCMHARGQNTEKGHEAVHSSDQRVRPLVS